MSTIFKICISILLFGSSSVLGQETYNDCANALDLCPGLSYTVNNIDANATFCAGCEDDFTFCFAGENTIWFKFTTNLAGGDVSINISNINFQNLPGQGSEMQATIIDAVNPCVANTYSVVGTCENNQTGNFTLNAIGLPASTTYYVVVNGSMGTLSNAEFIFDIAATGTGFDRTSTGIALGVNSTTICQNAPATFTATLIDCPDPGNYNWFVNGALVATTSTNSFVTTLLNNGDLVSVEVACFTVCNETFISNSIPMTVQSFVVDAGPDFTIDKGESVQLQGICAAPNFTWTPNLFISNITIVDPVVTPTETIEYYLTGDDGTCSITDVCKIFVEDGLTIPNTFSPNADGVNDTWEILGIEKYPNCLVKIYNRWGQLVFQSTGYGLGKRWDGTYEGRTLGASAYYYTLDLRDDEDSEVRKGYISLVK